MAATQAENQQNDVNSDKVQSEQHLGIRNTLIQNGTEKSGLRATSASSPGASVVVTKTKPSPATTTKNLNLDMSQYRQDGAGTTAPGQQHHHQQQQQQQQQQQTPGGATTADTAASTATDLVETEVNQNSTSDMNSSYGAAAVAESASSGGAGADGGPSAAPGSMHGYGGFGFRGGGASGYGLDQHATDPGNLLQGFGQFSPQGIRHGFPGSKQPMIGPRASGGASPAAGPPAPAGPNVPPFSQQQRFISGQSISQQTGPTPTLNQLLQSSNPMHRYQNSYGHAEQNPYQQGWPAQKPITSYGGQALGPGPASAISGPVPSYRNQTSQLSAGYVQDHQQSAAPAGAPRQAWSGGGAPPSSPGQPAGNRQSPQPGNHSPGPAGQGMPPSPQQQQQHHLQQQLHLQQQQQQQTLHNVGGGGGSLPTSSQPQPFPNRPAQPTTPNAHAPDAGDLTGQNSNDSSSGPAPGTPNSQGMRPTPSPTGSTGSRSMSPAVGQQNIPMPPRPSSSQSDGGGPTRMSHSPMATPVGYQQHQQHQQQQQQQQHQQQQQQQQQQHLGPPPHMHGYKMTGGHLGMVPPTGQQMPMYNAPNQQYPQSGYPGRTQQQQQQYGVGGGAGAAVAGMPPNQGYGGPPGQQQHHQQHHQQHQQQTGSLPNSMSPGQQYQAGRPVPNHVPGSQFPGYQQNWVGPGAGGAGGTVGPTVMSQASKGVPVSVSGGGPQQQPGGGAGHQQHHQQHQPNNNVGSVAPRPPHYLKQHLQHKMGFVGSSPGLPPGGGGMPPSPGPPQQQYGGTGSMGTATGIVHLQQHGSGGGGMTMGPPPVGHHHSGMGPPTSMGPPNMVPPSSGIVAGIGIPGGGGATTASTVTGSSGPLMSNSHHGHDGPMPPPSSTSNSHGGPGGVMGSVGLSMHSTMVHGDNTSAGDMLDNGITTTAGGTMTHVTAASGGSVTSVVTTGPDGTTLDEGSQQSTLSNASAASGEDPQCSTPKSRKNEMGGGGHYSHPATPQSTVPSPGAASMNSMHEEYDMSSPSWPRTPASPVFNSHVAPSDTYRSKKTDSLGKLYEMDDSPDRRAWLDKLLAFMEERRTPITTCPTISKNPLDLFRLYVYVKERGGFMEVTKNKTWKDIAGMLGIGASSSAAYTLRKHYTKNLLAFECQFDRGGIDPQPIINQVEASSKKKGAKAASVPSPGSSNSQDSFPAPGSSGASMDGYSGYGYPPGSTAEYASPPMQRPSSQSNAPSPHAGAAVPNHHGGPAAGGPPLATAAAADNVNVSNPFDDVSPSPPPRPPAGTQYTPGPHPSYGQSGPPRPQGMQQTGYPGQQNYNQYPGGPGPGTSPDQYQSYPANSGYPPATRPMYPPYGPEADRSYTQSNNSMVTNSSSVAPITQGNTTNAQDPYNRYSSSTAQVSTYGQPQNRPAYCTPPAGGPPTGTTASQPPAAPYPGQQDYYRSEQGYSSQQQPPPVSGAPTQMYPNGPPSKTMPPPAPQPRRHPDFAKDQQTYPPYGQQRPQMYGWPNSNQYRGQYQSPSAGPSSPQQWNQVSNRTGGPPHNSQPVNNQPAWEHRYPNTGAVQNSYPAGPGNMQQGQQWSSMSNQAISQNASLRPPLGPRSAFRSDGKPFNMLPPQNMKSSNQNSGITSSSYPQQPLPKREISFPADSVEAILPVLYRRKRICRMDLGNVDAWKVMMSLKSGLLTETTYALDMLNILLFDDTTVSYFGLSQWPGLLELLLEHFRKSLVDMFDEPVLQEPHTQWYGKCDTIQEPVDLGAVVNPINPEERVSMLNATPNFSQVSRKGRPVRFIDKNDDIFVQDGHKDWDTCGDAVGSNNAKAAALDTWQLGAPDPSTTKYILPCFQAEFDNVPFCKPLEDSKNVFGATDTAADQQHPTNMIRVQSENVIDEQSTDDVLATPAFDKRKRTKTSLSEVISRITKEPTTMNMLLTNTEKVKTDKAELDADANVKHEDIDLNSPSPNPSANQNGPAEESKPKTDPDCEQREQDMMDDEGMSSSGSSTEGSTSLRLNVRDPASTLKRRRIGDYEDECYTRDEASLCLITDSQDAVAKRCVCVSNILRNLTFVPGNEAEFAKSSAFLSLLGKLLLLHHEHPVRTHKTRNYDREEDADFTDSCSSLQGGAEWWWDFLVHIRENVLVSAANISGHMDLSQFSEEVARPILDGLLHWAICPSAHGQDPFSTMGSAAVLSPQRLALEALCKLCVTDANVDLVIATPPFSRLERLCVVLTKHLCRSEDQVLREFSINLLHYLAAADSAMARVVAMQSPCVSLLVAFIEQAEQSALGVANQHGIGALRENPDSMGTSLDMLRRAAGTLLHLAKHPDNRPLFMQQEHRLLNLVMSQILDQQVAFVIARVLFHISRTNENPLHIANS